MGNIFEKKHKEPIELTKYYNYLHDRTTKDCIKQLDVLQEHDLLNYNNESPFRHLLRYKNNNIDLLEVGKTLLKLGVSPNSSVGQMTLNTYCINSTLFFYTCAISNSNRLELVKEMIKYNPKMDFTIYDLILAISNGEKYYHYNDINFNDHDIDVIEYIVSQGVPLDNASVNERIPLLIFVTRSEHTGQANIKYRLLTILLEAGADQTTSDKDNKLYIDYLPDDIKEEFHDRYLL